MLGRIFWTVIIGSLAIVLLKIYVLDFVRLENNEMAPTLLEYDYILATRRHGPIDRGDVVLMRHPHNPEKLLIRRVVGMEGDEVEIKDGMLSVNGKPVEREEVGEIVIRRAAGGSLKEASYILETETLWDRKIRTVHRTKGHLASQKKLRVVGGLYVVGDNRSDAVDSRRFGPVRRSFVRGKVLYVLQASKHASPALDPAQRRWSRVR